MRILEVLSDRPFLLFLQTLSEKKRIAFYTLGCKLNFSETSQLSRMFPPEKFCIVDFKEMADIYVINTCVVTEKAEKKSRAVIRQAQKRNPKAVVAAVGCYSELHPDELAAINKSGVILGTYRKFSLPEILSDDNNKVSSTEELIKEFIPSYSTGDRTRSFFKIQDGCDYFCSYCTVPYARGRSRSATITEVLQTAKGIAATGVKEMILTGVNVGDFGRKNNENFIDLLRQLDFIDGVERIRISSIEPDLLTDEIIDFVSQSNKFLPHFHIPLQSGSDKVLMEMGRRYDKALFAERVKRIKSIMPDCCVAIDLIVGFPGESEDDFKETYDFISASDISYMHVFTYSERENTRAAERRDGIQNIVRQERSKKMLALSAKKKNIFLKNNTGKIEKVLFESENDNGSMYGYTGNYIKVKIPFDTELINTIKDVRLVRIEKDGIFAIEIVNKLTS
jgi:threonylcarbamoyladenosine tRNA methylthiotransferase MtaB